MKRCSYCGKEYPDEATVCAIDATPLVAENLPGPKPPIASRISRAAILSLLTPGIVIFAYIALFAYLGSHGRTGFTTLRVLVILPMLLLLAGIVLGIVALVRIKRPEPKRGFAMAVWGVILNALLLVALIVGPVVLPFILLRNYPRTPEAKLERAEKELAAASNQEKRFYVLDAAAKESFETGKIENARNYATELLSLAPQFLGNWNYGNAIQDGNLVLGRIAVREERIEEAKQYLLAAGKSPGSPQMNSFGPNMSLAKDLLEKGERDVVLQYFELCRKFWKMDGGMLDDWSKEVKAGGIPDFGANLVY